jgi:hypothetical protein
MGRGRQRRQRDPVAECDGGVGGATWWLGRCRIADQQLSSATPKVRVRWFLGSGGQTRHKRRLGMADKA